MKFIAFDLETTGFIPETDSICEISALLFSGSQVESEFSTLVDPQQPIPVESTKINGITQEMVQGKPSIEKLLKPFAEFCADHIMVAHNALFDYQFLAYQVKKHEIPAPKGLVLDTLGMARKVFPGLPNYKLSTLVKHLKIPAERFHRARNDAFYCGQLFQAIIQKINNNLVLPEKENLVRLTGKPELLFPQIIPRSKQLDFFS